MYDYQSSTNGQSASPSVSDSQETQRYNVDTEIYMTQEKQHDAIHLPLCLSSRLSTLLQECLSAPSALYRSVCLEWLLNIVYTLVLSFDEFGTVTKALISGIALIVLIGVAYWKLEGGGHHDDTHGGARSGSSMTPPPFTPTHE